MTKIFAVEDDADMTNILTVLFESQGWKCKIIPEGKEAEAEALAFSPDLIILDVGLPDTNGFELCQQFQKNSLLKKIPIMFLTATKKEVDHKIYGLNLGAVDYILKPFNQDMLLARIKAILRAVESQGAG